MGVNKVSLSGHPLSVYIPFLGDMISDRYAFLCFKAYRYEKHSFYDDFRELHASLKDINFDWFDDVCYNFLHRDEELAMMSIIESGNGRFFVPMVDLSIRDIKRIASVPAVRKFVTYWGNMDFFVFFSGRSYHLYGDRLFQNKERWLDFMASLLLLNEPGSQVVVDARWVGHRIMAGYAALRITNNSTQYKRYPLFCGMLSEFL